jgi:hypothetical protein
MKKKKKKKKKILIGNWGENRLGYEVHEASREHASHIPTAALTVKTRTNRNNGLDMSLSRRSMPFSRSIGRSRKIIFMNCFHAEFHGKIDVFR